MALFRDLNKKFDAMIVKEDAGLLKPKHKKSRVVGKFFSNKLAFTGVIVFGLITLLCIMAPLIAPFSPDDLDLMEIFQPPSAKHIFGTDATGQDIFSNMLYGGRLSILIGLGSALGGTVIGLLLGCYCGYKGGWVDAVVMKISEVFLGFPQIILVLVLAAIIGQSSVVMLIAIFIITGWPGVYRMARSQVLSLREEEYVQALRAFGMKDSKIVFKHILPNLMGPIMVNITLTTAMNILQESSLSFLGVGVPNSTLTWGSMLSQANVLNVFSDYWWVWVTTGAVLVLFILAINFIGDGLRDATDPTMMG